MNYTVKEWHGEEIYDKYSANFIFIQNDDFYWNWING